MKKVIFDSDLIGDDLLTLIAMTGDQNIHLEAVTVYGRRIGALGRCRIAQELLERLHISGVALVPGSDKPLVQEAIPGCQFCDYVIERLVGKQDPNFKSLTSDIPSRKYKNRIIKGVHAANYLIEKTLEEPGVYSLLCTGPLTNIALACSIDPTFPERLAEVVVMGGVWSISGNSGPKTEANIFNDPEAARIVFDRFKNVMVVPLDVTLQVAFTRGGVSEDLTGNKKWCLKNSADQLKESSEMCEFIEDLVNSCCDAHLEKGTGNRMPLHDLLAFLVLTDRSFVRTRKCSIHIETHSLTNRGMMVFDFIDSSSEHELAIEVDTQRALKRANQLLERF